MPREAPSKATEKMLVWRRWSSTWTTTYLVLGTTSAALASVVALNTKAHFLPAPADWILAALVAALAFLTPPLGAQAKGAAFELAARELEKSIALYEFDTAIPDSELGLAQQRGVDLLNKTKPS